MASEQPVSLRGAVGMEFELKVDGNPADAMYPLTYPFGNHVQAREPYPQPTGEWKNDRLLFESQPPKGVERFQIALSGKPEKLIYQERNIRFLWGGKFQADSIRSLDRAACGTRKLLSNLDCKSTQLIYNKRGIVTGSKGAAHAVQIFRNSDRTGFRALPELHQWNQAQIP